ncbi:MAG: 1-acyl-sn-glycerol-3-phosphate acyltransferase [Ruminococcaceae bacterium]|nr:1-acyl-sn-glycerol-3-phosphate acyltransferase [Oscillospiraceae bacterium]
MLNLIFLLLSVFATVGTYAFGAVSSLWWIPLLLIGGYLAAVIVYLLFLWVCTWFLPTKKPISKPKPFCRFMIRVTMEWVMTLLHIKVEIRGLEKMPDEPCVVVCNHRSDFDPMTLLAVLKNRKIAYISKASNFKIPLVGPFIFHAGFLAIDRENAVRAVRTLKTAAHRMQETGVDIGIYPEGTRSRTNKLLRFKSGAFVLAKDADAPIAVMSTKGTELISKRAIFRRVRVKMEILEVIGKQDVRTMSAEELSARSKELIEISLYGAKQTKAGEAAES